MELCCCPRHQHKEGHGTCRRASPSQLGFSAIISGLGSRLRRRTSKYITVVMGTQQPECTTSSFNPASSMVYDFYLHLLKVKINKIQIFPPVMHY